MSSPIAIPPTSRHVDHDAAFQSSPYKVPMHNSGMSTPSSSRASSPALSSTEWTSVSPKRRRASRRARSTRTSSASFREVSPSMSGFHNMTIQVETNMTVCADPPKKTTPATVKPESKGPFIYSIRDLLAFSQSLLNQLTLAQLEDVRRVMESIDFSYRRPMNTNRTFRNQTQSNIQVHYENRSQGQDAYESQQEKARRQGQRCCRTGRREGKKRNPVSTLAVNGRSYRGQWNWPQGPKTPQVPRGEEIKVDVDPIAGATKESRVEMSASTVDSHEGGEA
ncbi:unnamed protein product [Somion occarium]|uniref:Uncharacterized protein n=1 Tax=Somion occarium TaxID=3059160 RepID=A0ABP1CX38_9APHY